MASKFGSAGGIPERRVRPIWDAVDSRQFKAALKLCTALLAKYPNSPYAFALKALVLERMGKVDEALTVCLSARQELLSTDSLHIDDLTLSTLQIVFQRLDHLDLSTSCYEHACEKLPNNLELMIGLFNCYVREYAFVKQQQTAIKMYKIVGEERFLLWAVCSILLQVLCNQGGEKLLSLAEALLKKHIGSHSLHEPEGLLIYISLLEQQAKYSVALETLSGTLGSLVTIEVDKLRMQGRLLARAGDFAAAAENFQKVLQLCRQKEKKKLWHSEFQWQRSLSQYKAAQRYLWIISPDDWESFVHYLDCVLEVDICWPDLRTSDQIYLARGSSACNLNHLSEDEFDHRIENVLLFIDKLQKEANNDLIRCPYLAKVEIEKRRRLKGRSVDGRLFEVFLEYFGRFSHLACFASDIEVCLDILNPNEKMELLDRFIKHSQSCSGSQIKMLGHTVTVYKLHELFGAMFRLSTNELRSITVGMVETCGKNIFLSRDLDPQENLHGEELLTMASSVLVQLFWRSKHFGYLLEAIMILEFGLTIRRSTWQYKVLLLHLYCLLGATPLALHWYKSMEIKNILLESLGHHMLPHMLQSPLLSELDNLMKDYLKFMDDYMREAADLTFLAYRQRNYTKVIEFVQFKERLQHSHQYLVAKIEAPILQLKQKSDSLAETECILENMNGGSHLLQLTDIDFRSLTFNYDLQSRPWWSPTLDENYLLSPYAADLGFPRKCKNYPENHEQDLYNAINRRSLLPRLVYLSIHSCSALFKETVEANGSTSDRKADADFKSLLEKYSSVLGHPFDETLKIITEISDSQRSLKDLGVDMVFWMNFAIFFNAWSCSHPLALLHGASSSSWNVVDSLVRKCTSELLASAKHILESPVNDLSTLVQLVSESYSWHILVICSCLKSMLPAGKKKRKGSSVDRHHLPLCKAIQNSTTTLTTAISDVKRWLLSQLNQPVDSCLDSLLNHIRKGEREDGPGQVLHILEEITSTEKDEFGPSISQAVQSWSSVEVARKIISGQHEVLSKFLKICDSKLRLLESLKIPA